VADFENLGFETAGPGPGQADGWTTSVTGGAEAFGDFSVGPPAALTPAEDFEAGWNSNEDYLFALDNLHVEVGQFNTGADATHFESFEIEWLNDAYLFTLGAAAAPPFAGGGDSETFETGWDNDSYLFLLGGGDVAVGVFTGGESFDSFEEGWSLDSYLTTLSGGDVVMAAFDEGANAFETFVAVIAPFSFSVSSSVFQAAAHPLANNNRVVFTGPGLPPEIVVGLTYYVINKTTNTFQVSLTQGGSAVTVSNSSSVAMRCKGDPAVYWTESF
jgi:hypothetical protein